MDQGPSVSNPLAIAHYLAETLLLHRDGDATA
jgi:hypothetical protein